MSYSTKRSRQLLSTLFALNKTYTKRLAIGLEYDHIVDVSSYKPVVRITSRDFDGIPLTFEQWEGLKAVLNDFSNFFSDETTTLVNKKIYGDGWIAIYRRGRMRGKSTKFIELIEYQSSGSSHVRKSHHHVKLRKDVFECLESAAKCVDDRFGYLNAINKYVSDVICEYYYLIVSDCELNYNAQITCFTKNFVHEVNNRLNDSIVDIIVDKLGIKSLDRTVVPFSENDVIIILHEVVAFHLDELVESFNIEIMYNDHVNSNDIC